jgi:hypothetical protein
VTEDIQEALDELKGLLGKDLYLAKLDTCSAAFNALKEVSTAEEKLGAVGKYFREWIDRSAAAIRLWTPKYAALADAAGIASKDKWEWVKENVTEKLQESCTGSVFPGSWGGAMKTWEPIEWWIRNACHEAPSFLILRDESWTIPQWLRPTASSNPIDYYRTIQRAELGRELQWALALAKVDAATSSTPSNLQTPDIQTLPQRGADDGGYSLGHGVLAEKTAKIQNRGGRPRAEETELAIEIMRHSPTIKLAELCKQADSLNSRRQPEIRVRTPIDGETSWVGAFRNHSKKMHTWFSGVKRTFKRNLTMSAANLPAKPRP